MTLRAANALLLLAALSTGRLSAAAEVNPFRLKTGARGPNCLSCHEDFKDSLKLPSVHTPVKSGACTDCHDPHASSHGKLLSADESKICLVCHAGIVPAGAQSVHKAIADGQCVRCHDPHASRNKYNLLQAGNEVCFTCHKDVAAAVAANRFKHAPVEKGCVTCHDPHAGAKTASLLKKSQPALCTGCHRPDQPAFLAQHMNYPVATARCTSCHDPHGSNNRGILWASVHPPVANKMCSQCHFEASSPTALRTKKTGFELCRGCHNDLVNEMLSKNRLHWPVADGRSCLNCHNPHASKEKRLLGKPTKALCGSCHSDTMARQARSLTKHPPAEEGSCETCHAPHASDNDFLLVNASTIELCGSCHDWQKHSSHPIGEKVIDKRNKNLSVDCTSCHRVHGSEFKSFMAYDAKAELCVQCHEELRR